MVVLKRILEDFNLFSQAKKYKVSIWQYPPFLFLIIGIVIILTIFFSYIIGTKYFPQEYVVLGILVITTILLVLNYIIVNSFERLAEVNLMKSEFIDIISHQLRTPLSNLRWTLDLAKRENDFKKRDDFLKIISEQNERMLRLVNDMIYTSKIDQGTWVMKMKNVNLKSVTEKIIDDFTAFAKSNNIKIKTQIEDGLPEVFVDPQKISHVIYNLLSNALRYSKGGEEVLVKLLMVNNTIHFEVGDKGVGIPKSEQKYVFKKFFRGRGIARYRTEGMGLGLFIAKSIVESSKGKIGFKSSEQKGSIFWFQLPIKQS
ncbi:MAG: HAMP domain-containing sensor histidine kinase [Patescibacteria group bacterium]